MRRERPGGPCLKGAALGAAGALWLAGASPALGQTAAAGGSPAQAAAPAAGAGAGGAASLAKQLSNPVASLISVPFQLNWDEGLGPDEEGRRFLMNFQPVMPFKLNDDWNLIARVIVPVLAQPVLVEGGQPTSGLGDLLVSGFFSPSKGGLTWGVGPVIGLPVSSDPALGSGKTPSGRRPWC